MHVTVHVRYNFMHITLALLLKEKVSLRHVSKVRSCL